MPLVVVYSTVFEATKLRKNSVNNYSQKVPIGEEKRIFANKLKTYLVGEVNS